MENTIKETGKVRYALTFAAFQPSKCSQQHHIRSNRYSTSDRAQKYARPNGEKRYQYLSSLLPLTVTRSFHVPGVVFTLPRFHQGRSWLLQCANKRCRNLFSHQEGRTREQPFMLFRSESICQYFKCKIVFGGGSLKVDAESVAQRTTDPRANAGSRRKQLRHALDVALRRCSAGTDLQILDALVNMI